ncbi:MAG: NAD(P)H-binding protein [Pseudomonadota bacterium]
MIIIGAANGRIGQNLLKRVSQSSLRDHVYGGVRDIEKSRGQIEPYCAGAITVDYADKDALETRFEGAERVVLIPSYADTEARGSQFENVIAAAQAAGVQQVIFVGIMDTRSYSPLPFAHAYGRGEAALHASKLDFVILRTSMYIDNLEEQYPMWLKRGELITAAGDGAIGYVSRNDIAASILAVLSDPVEAHARRTYWLTGPEALNYAQVGEKLSAFFGNDIALTHVAEEEFAARLLDVWGVAYEGAEHVAKVTSKFQMVFREGLMSPVTRHVEMLTGQKPESVEEWFKRNIDPSGS